jgi:hypothetical protein
LSTNLWFFPLLLDEYLLKYSSDYGDRQSLSKTSTRYTLPGSRCLKDTKWLVYVLPDTSFLQTDKVLDGKR